MPTSTTVSATASAPRPTRSPLGKVALAAEIVRLYVRVRRSSREQRELPRRIAALRGSYGRDADRPELADRHPEAVHLASAVQRTLRVLPADAKCLTESLVLTGLLARHEIPSSLVIGVRPGDDFIAHAWVEYRGRALLPASQGVYHRLAEL